jgi:TRAF3-interacting protein 1
MIDALAFTTNVLSKANPFKIIAGLDPEETNGLLQLLAKAVIKKADFKEAVTRVLNGEHFTAGGSTEYFI